MGRYAEDKVILNDADLAAAFGGPWAERFPPVLTVEQAAELLQVPKSAIYHKKCEGKLDGTVTKVAGKLRFWRDRLLKRAFAQGL